MLPPDSINYLQFISMKFLEKMILVQLAPSPSFCLPAFWIHPWCPTHPKYFTSVALDSKNKWTRIWFLDCSKASNFVDRHKLFLFLFHSGVEHSLISFPIDYFHSRQQFTLCKDITSCLVSSALGVSQGALLSPFLSSQTTPIRSSSNTQTI